MGRRKTLVVFGVWTVFLFLVAAFGAVLNVPVVLGSGTIYIRADGSVDPPTAPIQRNRDLYTFTDTIYDSIVVQKSNITIDGNGYRLQGSEAWESIGIYSSSISNVTIKGTNIEGFFYGIHFDSSSYNIVFGNNITNNKYYGVYFPGLSNNNTIYGNNIRNNIRLAGYGVHISGSFNTISENNIANNGYGGGVNLLGSYNTISKNNITGNIGYGAILSGFHNDVLGNNIANNGGYGISISGSFNNISENNISTNSGDQGANTPWGTGVKLSGSNNTLSRNDVMNNVGIWLSDANANRIYQNNLINKVRQVYVTDGSVSIWDAGYPSGGNYWTDYTGNDLFGGPFQNMSYSDEMGDVPYTIDANNEDKYPLMHHSSPLPANFTYIKPDGSIDPSTAPIHRIEDTYELTSNISGSLVVQRDNTMIDGRGYIIQGMGVPRSAPGVDLSYRNNVKVTNTKIQGFENGIIVEGRGKVTIEKNEIFDNWESGILIIGQSNVTIKENTIKQNKNGIATDDVGTHSGIVVTGNMIFSNRENGIYLNSYGFSYLSYYDPRPSQEYGYIFDVTVSSNNISLNAGNGIRFCSAGTYFLRLDREYGEGYGYIFNVIVSFNSVFSNGENGIYLYSGGYGSQGFSYIYNVSLVSNNVLSNDRNGIYLYSAGVGGSSRYSSYQGYGKIYEVTVSSNNVSANNENGIYLYAYATAPSRYSYIYNVTLASNNVSSNNANGILLYSSTYQDSRQGVGYAHIYNVAISSNNVSLNRANGLYLYSYGYGYGYGGGTGSIYNVTLSSNTVLSNRENGIYLYSYGYSEGYTYAGYGYSTGSVYNVTLSYNDVSSNKGNGLYIHSYGYGYGYYYGPGYGYIYHVTLLSNNFSLNGGNGLYLYSQGDSYSFYDAYGYGYIYDVTISSSTVSSNGRNGAFLYSDSHAYSYGDGYGYSDSYIYNFSLVSNTISKNYERGLGFDAKTDSYNVKAYHNNFINNSIQVQISESYSNVWDDGYPSGGNYWSEYTGIDEKSGPDQDQLGSDGIGDTPYVINVNNRDRYPLIIPWGDITQPVTTDDYNNFWHTAYFTITLTATDDLSGVAEIYYKINDGSTKTVGTDGQPLITTEGANNKLEHWSADKAGNEELPHKILTGIRLDKTAPTGSITINTDATYATSPSVTLTLTATDATSGVYQVRYSNDGLWDTEPWETPTPAKTWTLTSGDGTKTVYYQIKDNAGLISTTYSDTIALDTAPPAGSITIAEGVSYTNSTSLTLTLSANDATSGVAQMRFSNDNVTWSDWEPYATSKSWTLTTGDGTKGVTVQYKDNTGLISSYSDSIILDTTNPTANAGTDQTVNEDTPVTLDASASTDENGIATYTWTFTDITPQTLSDKNPTYTFANPGTYAITLNVTDAAGNWATDTVIITVSDITKPVANAGQDQTVNVGTTVTFDASSSADNVGIVSYEWNFGDGTNSTGKTTTHTYTTTGTYTVTLTVKDTAGNTAKDSSTITAHLEGAPPPPSEAFPMWIIGAAIAAIAITAATILLLTKRK